MSQSGHDGDDNGLGNGRDYLQSFAEQLNTYATTLSERERKILAAIIFSSMDPLERIRWRDITDILEPDEAAILNNLETEKAEV